MSQENVEIVRAAYEAWNGGDWDGVLRLAARDGVFDNSRAAGEWRGVHIGPDEVRRMMEAFTDPWDSWRIEVDELIEVGEETVVTSTTGHFRGRNGIEVTTRTNWVWTLRGGKVIRIVHFEDRDEALEAAGLSE